jgi:hypothetical protein
LISSLGIEMNKPLFGKWVWTIGLSAMLIYLGLHQAPLAYCVALQRAVLLGRYTLEQVTALLILAPLSALILWGIWTAKPKTAQETRKDIFKIISLTVSILMGIVLTDVVLRLVQKNQYVRSGESYHRRPNSVRHGTFVDVSQAAFTYPNAPAGYPTHKYTLTVDKRGLRNQTDLNAYDVVVLGDSFTEGSEVSDEQIWPALLAGKTGQTFYNLGISGGNPTDYLYILKQVGESLKPKTVLCMLYEGNDFRDNNFPSTGHERPKSTMKDILFRASPLRRQLSSLMLRTLGPVNTDRFNVNPSLLDNPRHPMYPISWLPLNVPQGSANYYAFDLKCFLSHCQTPRQFSETLGCRKTQEILVILQELCTRNGARLVVVYAPDKPHILLPAWREHLNPAQVRAYMAMGQKNLPPADQLLDTVVPQLDTFETVMADFCRRQSIEFVSLTGILRQNILAGQQAYFTYDQHWSPVGHRIVAEFLAEKIR